MRRIVAIAVAMLIVMLFLVPVALAADALPHSGRVLISTQGDITIPAGEQADFVMVVEWHGDNRGRGQHHLRRQRIGQPDRRQDGDGRRHQQPGQPG